MKLENRYLVFKRSDVDAYFNDDEKITLNVLTEIYKNARRDRGKKDLEALIIEKDWPEYEPVKQMLLNRHCASKLKALVYVDGLGGLSVLKCSDELKAAIKNESVYDIFGYNDKAPIPTKNGVYQASISKKHETDDELSSYLVYTVESWFALEVAV